MSSLHLCVNTTHLLSKSVIPFAERPPWNTLTPALLHLCSIFNQTATDCSLASSTRTPHSGFIFLYLFCVNAVYTWYASGHMVSRILCLHERGQRHADGLSTVNIS